MKLNQLIAALILPCAAAAAFAAPAKYVIDDQSTANLIDQAAAEAIWLKSITPATVKLYPAKSWGFLSQVEGGIDVAQKACVITARAVVLPRKGKDLVFKPAKSATTFGTAPNATPEQCKALGKAKLEEAVQALAGAMGTSN